MEKREKAARAMGGGVKSNFSGNVVQPSLAPVKVERPPCGLFRVILGVPLFGPKSAWRAWFNAFCAAVSALAKGGER